jgi:hypothetical protein
VAGGHESNEWGILPEKTNVGRRMEQQRTSAGSSEARLGGEEDDKDDEDEAEAGSAGRGASASSSTFSESESESSSWSKGCGGGGGCSGQGSLDGTSAPEPSTRRRFARDDVAAAAAAAAITAPRAGTWREVSGCRWTDGRTTATGGDGDGNGGNGDGGRGGGALRGSSPHGAMEVVGTRPMGQYTM